MSIKISQLPPKIGNSGISTGDIPISIGGITYRVNPAQLLSGGSITGIGVNNFIPKWNGASSLTNSNIIDDGTIVNVQTNMLVNSLSLGRGAGNNIENVAFGYKSLTANTTGNNNIAFGPYTLQNNISSNYNIAIGPYALNVFNGGGFNTAIGFNAMGQSVSGGSNTAIGAETLTNCNGADNTAIGFTALNNLITGFDNTAIGQGALGGIDDGNGNIGIGNDAGTEAPVGLGTSITNSIYIGHHSKGSSPTANNEIVIGQNAIGYSSDTIVLGGFTNKRTYLSGNLILGRDGYTELTDNGIDKIQVSGTVMSFGFKKSGGTASEFLKADGSVSTLSSLNIITGSGTNNFIPRFNSTFNLTNSHIIDNDINVSITSSLNVSGITMGTTFMNEKILQENNASLSTGLYSWTNGGITISAATATTFQVGAVQGFIVDSNDSLNSNPKLISYSGASGITTPYLLTAPATYILVNTASTLTLLNIRPTTQQRRDNIFLGVIAHPAGTFTGIGNSPDIIMNVMSQVRAMFEPTRLINEGVLAYANSTNLTLANTAGKLYGLGIGFITNGNNSPSLLNIAAGAPTNFQYRTQTGGTFSATTVADPLNYDVAGLVTAITGSTNQATNQRIYLLQNGVIRIQFGQTIYSTLTDAIAAASNESFVVNINAINLGILIGILSITKGCTNLANTTTARFLPVSKFGETVGAAAGISIGTLQTGYNNSVDPEIVTNNTLGALTIRRGSAADTNAVLQGQNGAGTNTFLVDGNGNLTGTTFVKSGGTSNQYLMADGSSSQLINNVTGAGTSTRLPKYLTSTQLGDSNIIDSGLLITLSSSTTVIGNLSGTSATFRPTDSAGPFTIQNARASNTSKIEEWKNITGGTTCSIDGNGFLILNRILAQSSTNDALVGFSDAGSGLVAIGQNIGAAGAVIQNTAGGNIALFQGTNDCTIDNNANVTANSFIKEGGTASQFLMADGSVVSYKEYTAVFNTTGTTVQVIPLINTVGAIVWTNIGTGRFRGTLTGAFAVSKCAFFANNGNGSNVGTVNFFRNDDDTVQLNTYITTNGSLSNDIIDKGSITIKIVP